MKFSYLFVIIAFIIFRITSSELIEVDTIKISDDPNISKVELEIKKSTIEFENNGLNISSSSLNPMIKNLFSKFSNLSNEDNSTKIIIPYTIFQACKITVNKQIQTLPLVVSLIDFNNIPKIYYLEINLEKQQTNDILPRDNIVEKVESMCKAAKESLIKELTETKNVLNIMAEKSNLLKTQEENKKQIENSTNSNGNVDLNTTKQRLKMSIQLRENLKKEIEAIKNKSDIQIKESLLHGSKAEASNNEKSNMVKSIKDKEEELSKAEKEKETLLKKMNEMNSNNANSINDKNSNENANGNNNQSNNVGNLNSNTNSPQVNGGTNNLPINNDNNNLNSKNVEQIKKSRVSNDVSNNNSNPINNTNNNTQQQQIKSNENQQPVGSSQSQNNVNIDEAMNSKKAEKTLINSERKILEDEINYDSQEYQKFDSNISQKNMQLDKVKRQMSEKSPEKLEEEIQKITLDLNVAVKECQTLSKKKESDTSNNTKLTENIKKLNEEVKTLLTSKDTMFASYKKSLSESNNKNKDILEYLNQCYVFKEGFIDTAIVSFYQNNKDALNYIMSIKPNDGNYNLVDNIFSSKNPDVCKDLRKEISVEKKKKKSRKSIEKEMRRELRLNRKGITKMNGLVYDSQGFNNNIMINYNS